MATSLPTQYVLEIHIFLGCNVTFFSFNLCACAPIRFRHKKYLVRVCKNITFWLQVSDLVATNKAGNVQSSHSTSVSSISTGLELSKCPMETCGHFPAILAVTKLGDFQGDLPS